MGLCASSVAQRDQNNVCDDDDASRTRQFDNGLYEPASKKDRFRTHSLAYSFIFSLTYPFTYLYTGTPIASISDNTSELIFMCDVSGNILNVNSNVRNVLLFSPAEIKGQFIGCIMSDFVSMLHSSHIFPAFKRADMMKRSAYSAKINALSNKRPLLIYDAQKKAYFAEISVSTVYTKEIRCSQQLSPDDEEYYFVIRAQVAKNQDDPRHLYTSGINHLRNHLSHFTETSGNSLLK